MEHHLAKLKIEQIAAKSEAMARCLRLAALAAKSQVPVLLLGETGTGKTLMARAIHNSSSRSGGAFQSFNAAAMSDSLLESQLFGHERGAFTGAHQSVKGKFELADGGTLFLDEVADMSPPAQVKILHALEYGEFQRLGSERLLKASVRVIAAANCSLRGRIGQGRFREDLYHRLAGLTLVIPSLRERIEELPALIAAELQSQKNAFNGEITGIHAEAMEMLLAHEWRGNLRELSHVVRTMALFCEGSVILPEHVVFPGDLGALETEPPPALARVSRGAVAGEDDLRLDRKVRQHIRLVLSHTNGNRRQAAKLLGISRAKLARQLNGELNGSG